MKIFIIISSTISFLYASSSHPILLMAFILTQTTGVCVMAWVKLKISWFSYILFLIFLGGLMVLFIYITSLASNELIILKMDTYKMTLTAVGLMLIFMLSNLNFQQTAMDSLTTLKTFYFMYSWASMNIIVLTMVYLLLTLIIVVKVSNKFEAPIKNLIF